MKLSIVATLYQSADYIDEFCARSSKIAQKLFADEFEIVLVNDGSPDNSLEVAVDLTERNSQVTVVDLSRNFGHHKAMMTGLEYASGELVFLIDSDLEEKPEWLESFYESFVERQCDVVYGVQKDRKGGLVERVSGGWFYRVFDLLTGMSLPKNIVTARLMSRRYVEALLMHRDREVFLAGLWHITGFEQLAYVISKGGESESTYTLKRKLSVLVNSVTSFSNTPLKFIFYVGVFISSIALISIAYLVVNKLIIAKPLSGWTSVMASIWLLGGMIISFLGIIGIYLAKIFSEIKERPYTIVRQVYGSKRH
jgi:putative glycosyltransferase